MDLTLYLTFSSRGSEIVVPSYLELLDFAFEELDFALELLDFGVLALLAAFEELEDFEDDVIHCSHPSVQQNMPLLKYGSSNSEPLFVVSITTVESLFTGFFFS